MTYSTISIISLLVHIIVNYDILRKKGGAEGGHADRQHRRFLIGMMLFHIADALWGVLYEQHLLVPLYIDTVLYFITMALSVLLWTRYVVAYLGEESRYGAVLQTFGWAFLVLELVFLAVNGFCHAAFWFDESGVYHAGALRSATLGLQVLLFFATSVYTLRSACKTGGKARLRHRTIGLFGLVMTVLTAAQSFYSLLPLYAVGCLLGACILHSFVLEDEKEERRLRLEELLSLEQHQRQELSAARTIAVTDALTGVKNKYAFAEAEARKDRSIADGTLKEFAVAVFDLNGLKSVNDTLGHDAGDRYIREGCMLICRRFAHSPVFRIGGDEFAAVLEGGDYQNRAEILAGFEQETEENLRRGGVVVSCGLDVFRPGEDGCLRTVFERADQKMYERKRALKAMEKGLTAGAVPAAESMEEQNG